jgi:hypothetical protein
MEIVIGFVCVSEDQMTCVVSRALPGVPSAKEGAR